MINPITVNNVEYTYKETFDINLTLSYENDTWDTWHIVREFISNALDSVSLDVDKVEIAESGNNIIIHDHGVGYPIVLAKRVGASSKKNDTSSIGMFGEGSKLALLTCVRKGINVMLSSQAWLIVPKSAEMDGQEVLMYDIYETTTAITGSNIILEATPDVIEITNNLKDYFLYYDKGSCLFGNTSSGVYPLSNGKAKLYNKGVFVRNIDAMFSYAITFEKLNRDRDFINHSDISYQIRDLWETVNNKDLIKQLMTTAALPSTNRNKLIEFYSSMYSNHPQVWSEAFYELYGQNACLFTNEIAQRKAEALGYSVIKMEYNFSSILKSGGVRLDTDGLADDFEFVFSNNLDKEEKSTLMKLHALTQLAGFEVPESIKVFDEYKQHSDIPGLYNTEKQQIYLRRDILKSSFDKALYTFIHEACHHSTRTDDISREFAESLCRKLAAMLLKYSSEIGIDEELNVSPKGIELPKNFTMSAEDMSATVIVADNELTIRASGHTLRCILPLYIAKPTVWSRKIIIYNNRFVVSIPEQVIQLISGMNVLTFKVM